MTAVSLAIMASALAVLIILSAFFSASETAFTSLNRIRIKNMANEGDRRAKRTLAISENYDRLLTTLLVGNNLVNIAASSIATLLFVSLLQDEGTGALAATVVMVILLLIFGEITPKSMAKRNAEGFALRVTPMLDIVITVFTPVTYLFTALTKRLSRNREEVPTMTEDELVVMIEVIEEEGTLEKRESELIKSAIQFDDIRVGEIITPRVDVVATDVRSDKESMRRLFRETGFSRIPLYDGTIDRVVGVVSAKDFFNRCSDDEGVKLTDIIRPVRFVPESTNIATLLNDLQKSKVHMAVVLDTYGGTLGIVSLEDILEELVGEIWDESDDIQYSMVRESDGSYSVLGETNIYDVMDEMGIRFDPEGYNDHSVSGYIHYKLGKIPSRGDKVEGDAFTIVVKSTKNRRIKEALVVPKALPPEDQDD